MRYFSRLNLAIPAVLLAISAVGCDQYHNCCEDVYNDPLYVAICSEIHSDSYHSCANYGSDEGCPSDLKGKTDSVIQKTRNYCAELFDDPNNMFDHLTYQRKSNDDDEPNYCYYNFTNPILTVGQICVQQSLVENVLPKEAYISMKQQLDYECWVETKSITDDTQRSSAIAACIAQKIANR